MPIKSRIRTIPNYPEPGVMFRDIMPLLQDPEGLRLAIDQMLEPLANMRIDKVAGIEARGFIIAGAIAHRLDAAEEPGTSHHAPVQGFRLCRCKPDKGAI